MERRTVIGLVLALVSAVTFSTSGSFARGLLETGWSPAAAVTWRVVIAGLLMVVPGLLALRGRWHLLRRGMRSIVLFGVVAVAGTQLAFFRAIAHVSVGVGLLLEFLGIILVVFWFWVRHGERPRPLTILGSALAIVGLLFILGIFGGVEVNLVGVLWGLAAAFGLATYFVVSSNEKVEVPPLVFSAGGLLVGAATLGLAGLVGIIELAWETEAVHLAGWTMPWWLDVVILGLVSTAVPYFAGVSANRRLGSKVASFVGLSEVMAAVVVAWILLAEIPAPIQLLGGVFILGGVIAVKIDETPRSVSVPEEVVPEAV